MSVLNLKKDPQVKKFVKTTTLPGLFLIGIQLGRYVRRKQPLFTKNALPWHSIPVKTISF